MKWEGETVATMTTLAPLVSAAAATVYAVIAAVSLWLLSRQIADARRFGAAPALYAFLKELDEHLAAIRRLGDAADANADETIKDYLEFFERIEHLRGAGVLPERTLAAAFAPPLRAHLDDPRFQRMIHTGGRQYEEVLTLAERFGYRKRKA